MRVHRFTVGLIGGLAGLVMCAGGAQARDVMPILQGVADPDVAAPPDLDWSFAVGGVLAAGAFDSTNTDPEPIVGAAWADINADLVFDNQVSIGLNLSLAASRNHPRVDPRGDSLEGVAPGFRSVHMDVAQGGPKADMGPRMTVERASIYLNTPFAIVRAGRDMGYAANVAAIPPNAPTSLAPADAGLDLTGLGSVLTRDFSAGASSKITITTQRTLGVDFGVSYTPEIEAAAPGATRRYGPPGALGAQPDSVLEAGASLDLRPPGWEIGIVGAVTISKADGPNVAGLFGDVETMTANFGLRGNDWYVGAAGLVGDNGWSGAGDRDYRSIALHAGVALDGVDLGVEIASGSDDLIDADLHTAMVSARYTLDDVNSLTVGLQSAERESGLAGARKTERAVGVFAEWVVDFRFGAR